jgi:dolichyl-phosphate-mannose-protein mannosyltransferase
MTATLMPAPAEPAEPVEASSGSLGDRIRPDAIPGSRLIGWLAPLGIAAVALVMRLWGVTQPRGVEFDEVYYTADARDLLHHGVEHNRGYLFTVHPPLGKWAIAIGEWMFGYIGTAGNRVGSPELGWRFMPAVAGAISVLVLARLARRMFRSTLLGCFAGLIMSLDAMHFVLSRTGILDIFVLFWLVMALGCLVRDRDDGRTRMANKLDAREANPDGTAPSVLVLWRPWRLLAGVCLGAMCATKWSGLYAIAAFILIVIGWDIGARRKTGERAPWFTTLALDIGPTVVALLIVPAIAYTASWTGWFLSNDGFDRHLHGGGIIGTLQGWIDYQKAAYKFHTGLSTPHPYMQNEPVGWLLQSRPVAFFYQSVADGKQGCTSAGGCSREVLLIGTPAIWWAGTLALFGTFGLWIARRDWRASLILVGFSIQFIPWLNDPSRTKFEFYAAPMLPFLVLALTAMAGCILGRQEDSERRRLYGAVIVGAFTLVVLINFAYLLPILTAKTIPLTAWQHRMWLPGWV